ncbi:hypothetical protein OF83DRAFT_1087698 [Amylostereum chailletii]|nr:hypothetical protein OF83DRAFT_1087698 [Amylostereum chailletii]
MNWFHKVLGMPDEDAMNEAILVDDIVISDALERSVSRWWENPDLLVPEGNTVESSLLPSNHMSALVSPKSEVEAGAMGGGSSLGGSADEESEEEDLPNFNLPSFGSPERDCQQESGFPLSLDEGGFPPPDFCIVLDNESDNEDIVATDNTTQEGEGAIGGGRKEKSGHGGVEVSEGDKWEVLVSPGGEGQSGMGKEGPSRGGLKDAPSTTSSSCGEDVVLLNPKGKGKGVHGIRKRKKHVGPRDLGLGSRLEHIVLEALDKFCVAMKSQIDSARVDFEGVLEDTHSVITSEISEIHKENGELLDVVKWLEV